MSATLHEATPRAESAEFDRLTARLAAADRSLQQEKGMLLVLRSWRWLVPCFFGAIGADVLLHLSPPVRLALSCGFLSLLLGTLGRAIWLACFRRSPLEHTARVLEARDPQLGSKLINILQLRAQADDARVSPLTRELAACAVASSASELAGFNFQNLTGTSLPAREAKRLGVSRKGVSP